MPRAIVVPDVMLIELYANNIHLRGGTRLYRTGGRAVQVFCPRCEIPREMRAISCAALAPFALVSNGPLLRKRTGMAEDLGGPGLAGLGWRRI
jgi:hypothetical protein